MTRGVVINIRPGKSIVRLESGEIVVAKNQLNVRTPPRSTVTLTHTARGWAVVGRDR